MERYGDERKKKPKHCGRIAKTAGLTQAEMAVRLQVCRQTYCRYERCPETMPLGIAARFAGVVGRSAIALFLAGISTGGG